jgi:hypothetical protein
MSAEVAASENRAATRARAVTRGESSGVMKVSCAAALVESKRFVVRIR